MKLIEYLKPIPASSRRQRVLATMYFLAETEGRRSVSVADIRTALVSARAPGAKTLNISAVLGNAGSYVHAETASAGAKAWELTESGRRYVEGFAPIESADESVKTAVKEATALRAKVAAIGDAEARAFAQEALDCLEIGAHRAAIVFMWVAAVHELQERIWATGNVSAIVAAAQSHNPRAKVVKKRDDLSEYNEELLLQVAQDLGVIDKNQKTELAKALQLRNGSGHPNKLRPGEHKAKAHFEDIITMLF
jgi:hypothetical protein